MKTLEDILKEGKEAYTNAETADTVWEVINEPGTYQCEISKVEIKEVGKDDKVWKVIWSFRVIEGKHKGSFVPTMFTDLEGYGIEWTKKALARLGVAPEDPEDIPKVVAKLPGLKVEVSIVEKNGYINTYLNKKLGEGETKTDSSETTTPF